MLILRNDALEFPDLKKTKLKKDLHRLQGHLYRVPFLEQMGLQEECSGCLAYPSMCVLTYVGGGDQSTIWVVLALRSSSLIGPAICLSRLPQTQDKVCYNPEVSHGAGVAYLHSTCFIN